MTHGEKWLINKNNFYRNGKHFDECDRIDKRLPKRMSKDDVLTYYNNKLNLYWKKINLTRKKPMAKKLKDTYYEAQDNDIIRITKGQLNELMKKVREDAITSSERHNFFNADEILYSLKEST